MEKKPLTPRQIVDRLDQYIVGQQNAKKAVAVALRNRYRRSLLDEKLKDEVVPKNILMMGPTGVGKTEIARRIAKLAFDSDRSYYQDLRQIVGSASFLVHSCRFLISFPYFVPAIPFCSYSHIIFQQRFQIQKLIADIRIRIGLFHFLLVPAAFGI